MRRAFLTLQAMGLALGLIAAGPTQKTKEKTMLNANIPFLPFGLDQAADPTQIVITLAYESGKPDGGRQEITLTGEGKIRLFYSRSRQDKSPRILEGACLQTDILRLLDFMEGNGVGNTDPAAKPLKGAYRTLDVNVPGMAYHQVLQESDEYSIQQVIGAVKMAAGQCLPEALNHRFFPNL